MSSDELTEIAGAAAHGGLFLFAGNTSSTVILAIGVIVVARLLGPLNYGLYTLTVTIPVLLIALADVGMNYALIRIPTRLRAEGDHARANRLIKLGFILKLTISAIAFIVCYADSTMIATVALNRPQLAPFIQLASLMIIFQSIDDACTNIFIGLDQMHYSAGIQVMQATLKATVAPVLVFLGLGITGAIWGSVLAMAAAALTGALLLFTKHVRSSSHATNLPTTELRTLLGYGLPLYAASILSVFLTQYQNIVLAHFASNVEIGNFSATWSFTAFMMILVYPITTAMFPMFSKMHPQNQRDDLSRAFTFAVKYSSLLMIPASIMVMIFSHDLIAPYLRQQLRLRSPVSSSIRCALPFDRHRILDTRKFSERSRPDRNRPQNGHIDALDLRTVKPDACMAMGTVRGTRRRTSLPARVPQCTD